MKKFFNGKTIMFLLCISIMGGWAVNYEIDRYNCVQQYSEAYCKQKNTPRQYSDDELKKARQINDMIN